MKKNKNKSGYFNFLLQNKMFIYRGKEYSFLEDFSLKLLSQFPNAVRMTSTAPPADDICNSPAQCILPKAAERQLPHEDYFNQRQVQNSAKIIFSFFLFVVSNS